MNGLFDCDTVWCCWTRLVEAASAGVWATRWWWGGYLALYAVGAGLFLLYLRVGSEGGRLVVRTDSWAYMLAHPLRYGGHKDVKPMGSICPFYARLLNMLLFVWPLLLLYFALGSTVVSLWAFLSAGRVLTPDLHSDGFFKARRVTFPLGLIIVPVALLFLALYHFRELLAWFAQVGWAVACLAPAIVIVGGGLFGLIAYRRLMKDEIETDDGGNVRVRASAFKETLQARKEKFCKMVEFRQ